MTDFQVVLWIMFVMLGITVGFGIGRLPMGEKPLKKRMATIKVPHNNTEAL